MEQMGYGEQPFVMVRHTDTGHEHVHIITTNVDDDGKVLGIFNSYRRNVATQRYLEKKVRPIALATYQTAEGTTDLQITRTTVRHGHCPRDEVLFAGCAQRNPPKTQSAKFRGAGKNS